MFPLNIIFMFLYSIGLPMVLSHYFQSISQCVFWNFQVEKYGVTLERFSLLNYLNFNVAMCVFKFCFRILLLKRGFLAQYMGTLESSPCIQTWNQAFIQQIPATGQERSTHGAWEWKGRVPLSHESQTSTLGECDWHIWQSIS